MRLRSTCLFLTAAALTATVSPALAQNSTLDEVVLANVGSRTITRRDLVTRLMDYRGDEALDKMVGRVLVQQAATRLNLAITDEEVGRKLSEIQSRFRSEADYRNFLATSRLQEHQLREETRTTLLLQKIALKEAPIKDEDLEQFDVRMIVASDKATAEKWIAELPKGDFTAMASDRSTDPVLRQAKGKLRPFLKIEMIDVGKAIDEFKMKPGDVTPKPVQLSSGKWGIIRLERRLPVDVTASAAERERLVAMVTAFRVDQWITEARAKAKVVKLPATDKANVATVNGQPITRQQLTLRLLEFYGEEALEQMANREVLIQSSKAQNVSISDDEAEKLFKEVRVKFPTADDWGTFLVRSHLSEKQLRDEIRYNALMERVALKESPVTDTDLQQYDVRMIVAASEEKAEGIAKELEAGEDFGRMASFFSTDPAGRTSGGRMKPFLKIDMLDVWRVIDAQKLKPGGYTKKPALLTDNSYVLVKLENVITPSQVTPEAKERLRKRVVEYRVAQWLEQARTRSKITYPTALSTVIREQKPS
ncbi:MAG: SurA N-terminal domain-containing protein [Actinomycetota bacterium]